MYQASVAIRLSSSTIQRAMYNRLPGEVKFMIFSFVTSKEDLRALCLVSRDDYEFAIRFLYEDVYLSLGGPLDCRLSGLINHFNRGLQHIRHLNVGFAENYSGTAGLLDQRDNGALSQRLIEGSIQQAHIMLKLLFETFQRNSPPTRLHFFRWTSWESFSLDNWVSLYQNQSQLRNLEVVPLDRPYTSILSQIPDIVSALAELSDVALCATSLDVLEAFQRVLQAQPNIQTLDLIVSWDSATGAREDLNDTSTEPGLMCRTIFSHMNYLHETPLKELQSVSLENFPLKYADRYLMKAVPFKSLKTITLGNCTSANGLFHPLCKAQHLPSKLTTLHWYHESKTESHILNAFERLLGVLSTIKDLHVELANTERLPKATAISRSTSKLRSLVVQAHNTQSVLLRYQSVEIDAVCTTCTRLRQLSIAAPVFDVAKYRSSCDWTSFLACMWKLPCLITLHVQVWPHTYPSPDTEMRENYGSQLQQVAQHMFAMSDIEAKAQGWGFGDRSTLAVVAFGANGESWYPSQEEYIMMKQTVFTRGKTVDGLGRTKMAALKTLSNMQV